MRDDLTGLLEKADLALASASGVIEDDVVAPLIDSVRGVRTRLAYPDDVLVVALAGGTGSGKSSLLNALCDEELADVGGIRPTTSSPAAAVPTQTGAAMDGYLDRLGVPKRYTHDREGICLIDLPDTDSVEVEHRHRVDALLPLVDVVVWVLDPEKYRDAGLHTEYLAPMSDYSAQFLFVLNQVDRLEQREVEEVRADLKQALIDDGFAEAVVIPTATAPPVGPPIGLDDLVEALEAKRADRSTLYGKLLTDLASTCHSLESAAGTGLDFDERAEEVVGRASAALASEDPTRATDILTDFLGALQGESGGITADKLAGIAADVPDHVLRIDNQLAAAPKPVSWFRRMFARRQPSNTNRADQARLLLSEAVIRPTRAVLARRAVAVASVAELAIDVEDLRPDAHG